MVAYAWRKVQANARSWRSQCSKCRAQGEAGVARLAVTKRVFNGPWSERSPVRRYQEAGVQQIVALVNPLLWLKVMEGRRARKMY